MMRSLLWRAFLGVQFVVAVRYSASQENVADVVKRSSDAIVLIVTSDSTGRETALGSGFLVSSDGKLVTNFHVIKGAHSAVAKLANGAFFPVDGVLAADVDGDLVLLKVPGKGLPFLTLDGSAGVKVGDHVVAIGSPLGLEGTVSDGIVSAIRSETPAKNWIQTTAPVSHGNSGGPLLGMDGNVVGVITWGVNLQEGQNLNFAIPSDKVQSLLAMHEQLSPVESVASIRTQEADANPPDKTNSPDTGRQRAIEQLRAIAQAIKACDYQLPGMPGLPDRMVREGFKEVFGPPTNVIWDIESKQSIRSPYMGYVEYSVPAYMELPPTDDYCNARDIKKSECKRMWIIGQRLYREQVVSPQQFRYEFDITPNGLEYSRGFEKKRQKEGEPWVEAASPDGCAARAIRSMQQAGVGVDTGFGSIRREKLCRS
jgi:S1-C subfamily serine protease